MPRMNHGDGTLARVHAAFEAAARLDAFQKAAPENQVDADVADAPKGAR